MRCPSCDAPALTDDARFCIGCGAAFPEPTPGSGRDPHPVETASAPRAQEHRFEPRPPREPRVAAPKERAPSLRELPPLRDPEPTVPVPVVIGGVVVLLAVLLVLLVAS